MKSKGEGISLSQLTLKGLIIILFLISFYPSVNAVSSDYKIIYDLPFFDNYGPAFSTWTGGGDPPLGSALLKGQISVDNDKVKAGNPFDLTLDLYFSGSTIGGFRGAIMKTEGGDDWYLNTKKITGEDIKLGEIRSREYLGISEEMDYPPVVAKNITHTYEVEIPEDAERGTYDIYAYVSGTKYKTAPLTITVI